MSLNGKTGVVAGAIGGAIGTLGITLALGAAGVWRDSSLNEQRLDSIEAHVAYMRDRIDAIEEYIREERD